VTFSPLSQPHTHRHWRCDLSFFLSCFIRDNQASFLEALHPHLVPIQLSVGGFLSLCCNAHSGAHSHGAGYSSTSTTDLWLCGLVSV
jgi:hypothetical protein